VTVLRLAAGLLVFLVGCSSGAPSGGAGQLLTGAVFSGGCFTNSASGPLVADPKYGTAIIDEVMTRVTGTQASPVPVAWRPGFSARQAGSEVEVVAPDGHVVATTGKRYRIDGGYVGPYVGGSSGWAGLAVAFFWACDRVTPL
jgi:hypothetical protein